MKCTWFLALKELVGNFKLVIKKHKLMSRMYMKGSNFNVSEVTIKSTLHHLVR